MIAATTAPPSHTRKVTRRSLRSWSRQGSRFMRGISVEAPQGQTAGGQQRRRITLHGLGAGARRKFHLAERIALFGRDTHAALDDIGDAGHVTAPAADQNFFRLFAAAARSQIELE